LLPFQALADIPENANSTNACFFFLLVKQTAIPVGHSAREANVMHHVNGTL